MPRLDNRLKAVASQIKSPVHIDIGSDHGHLLKALLAAGRIERGIAIENKQQPLENSQRTLEGLAADVRLGDGLEAAKTDEANSLSICGMGGSAMVQILESHPDRIPPSVVLQPNNRPELVREWGLNGGFHLVDEQIAYGYWAYQVLTFAKSSDEPDAVYEGLDLDAALLFGPRIIRSESPEFVARLNEERDYLRRLDQLNEQSQRRLEAAELILAGRHRLTR